MSKQAAVLLHAAIWVVLFLMPLTFFGYTPNMSIKHFVMLSVSPLITMLVFYANYLWLIPRYFMRRERQKFWMVNAVLVVVMGVAIHYWMDFIHNIFDEGIIPYHELTAVEVLTFVLHDIFQLAVAVFVATTIQMAVRWQHLETARREAEAARAEAELKNLRLQLNPHFLLNTLNNIYALTSIDPLRAQETIQELSEVMRHVLYDNQKRRVPLDEELQFLGNYVKLMRIRLPRQVEVTYETKLPRQGTAKIEVAPMIFASLVENAFKHGVSPTLDSYIHIEITADERFVRCDIRNSNHPKSEADHSGHGIGLRQMQHHLDIEYPGKYQWNYGVSDDGGEYYSTITIKP